MKWLELSSRQCISPGHGPSKHQIQSARQSTLLLSLIITYSPGISHLLSATEPREVWHWCLTKRSCCLRVCLWKVLRSPETSPKREINVAAHSTVQGKAFPKTRPFFFAKSLLQNKMSKQIKRAKPPNPELDHVSVVVWPSIELCVRELLFFPVLQMQNFRQHFKLMQ